MGGISKKTILILVYSACVIASLVLSFFIILAFCYVNTETLVINNFINVLMGFLAGLETSIVFWLLGNCKKNISNRESIQKLTTKFLVDCNYVNCMATRSMLINVTTSEIQAVEYYIFN